MYEGIKMESNRTSTTELFRLITHNPDKFRKYLKADECHFEGKTIDQFLSELCEKYEVNASKIIKFSLLSKSYVYQVFAGERKPSREVIIRICIVIGCSLDELQHALMIAEEGILYPKVRRDAAIMSCVGGKLSLAETDEFLDEIGEQTLLQ